MTAPAADKGGRRSAWITAAKALLTVVAIAVIAHRVPLGSLGRRVVELSPASVVVLLVVTIAQVGVGVVRWRRLLLRVRERVPFLSLFGDVLVGLAYNLFLPTTVGGDVVRALRASRRVSRPHRAWSTSVFERVAGLLAMAASGALAALVAAWVTVGQGRLQVPVSMLIATVAVTVTLMGIFFAASAPFRWLASLLARSGAGSATLDRAHDDHGGGDQGRATTTWNAARELADHVGRDLQGPLATLGARVEALGWSLLYQALGIVFVIAGAAALGAPGHALAILVGVPLVHVLSMVPLTLGGLGLREGLFVAILGALGVPSDVALGLAMQWLASSVFFALAGAVVAWWPTKAPS